MPRILGLATLGVGGAAFALLLASAPTARAEAAGGGFKNLQVLPKNISKEQLKAIMKGQSKALGVDCDHCHEMPVPDKDTKNKKIAREMIKMTNEINSKFLKGMETKATCDTCHRGKEKPESVAGGPAK